MQLHYLFSQSMMFTCGSVTEQRLFCCHYYVFMSLTLWYLSPVRGHQLEPKRTCPWKVLRMNEDISQWERWCPTLPYTLGARSHRVDLRTELSRVFKSWRSAWKQLPWVAIDLRHDRFCNRDSGFMNLEATITSFRPTSLSWNFFSPGYFVFASTPLLLHLPVSPPPLLPPAPLSSLGIISSLSPSSFVLTPHSQPPSLLCWTAPSFHRVHKIIMRITNREDGRSQKYSQFTENTNTPAGLKYGWQDLAC